MLADAQQQPTLLELTSKALEVLGKNENGFVLLVEGGRIDHAHHGTMSQLALSETVEFHKTVEYAKSVTNEQDTLLLATADHSHVFTVGGYPVGIEIRFLDYLTKIFDFLSHDKRTFYQLEMFRVLIKWGSLH